jgi:hypothetical protein
MVRQARGAIPTTKETITTEAPFEGSTEPPVPTEPPGPGIGKQIFNKGEELFEKGVDMAAKKTKIPVWGVMLIVIGNPTYSINSSL